MQIIDLDISNKRVAPLLQAKQGDVGRKFRAVITDGGDPYDIPADAVLSVWYSGASGAGNYSVIGGKSAFCIDGNTVTVELITQMLNHHGSGNLCLVMNKQDGTQIGTWNIPYIVEQLPGMGSPAAEQYFTALTEAAAKAAESAAKAAEAAATFETDTTLSVAGKAADAAVTGAALAGKAPVTLGAPHNYLDNSDFRNPVNQRGKTAYSRVGYTIDRWMLLNNDGTMSIGDGYIELTGVSGEAWFAQLIPNPSHHVGKTVTFVVELADYQKVCVSGVLSTTQAILNDAGLLLYIHPATEDYIQLNMVARTGTSYQIRNVALYEGEYTAETLPDYKPKGYGAELAECQRYFIRLIAPTSEALPAFAGFGTVVNSTVFAVCSLPVPMRILPTVKGETLELITKDIAHYKTVSSLDIYPRCATNAVVVEATSSDTLTTGDIYYLVGRRSTSYLDLSADL